jgi:hypothetical protein
MTPGVVELNCSRTEVFMGNGWSRHYVALTPGSAGIRGVPHFLRNNLKTFNVHGPRKTHLRLLTVKRSITVTVEMYFICVFAAAVY